jgi:ABC-2 type transport system ATP-binding protein
MQIVTAKQVDKRFGSEEVLRGVDLALETGEILGILGPSGAGKTTLVRCLLGTLPLDLGEISIAGIKMPNLIMMDRIG